MEETHTNTPKELSDIIQDAKQESSLYGLFKYMYYISPLGYFFRNKEHEEVKKLTSQVWNDELKL